MLALRAETRFLDPRVLSRIGSLELVARTVVDGFINGLHRAPYFGLSVDFAEHRPYTTGDDIRRVDWRLYARTDRHYVKEFEADTNANVVALMDVSRSMAYGAAGISKLDYARYLAASLLHFSHGQRDRVGLATFDREVRDWVPASARHLDVSLHAIDRMTAGEEGTLAEPLLHVADRLRRRGIVLLISDLYEDPAAVHEAIRPLRGRGHEVIVFHLLDPSELEFPFADPTNLVDLETGERMPIVPKAMRERYREMVREHVAALSLELTGDGIDYALFDTSQPLDHALFQYLSGRERRSRVR